MKRSLLREIFSDGTKLHDGKLKAIEEEVKKVEKHIPNLEKRVKDYLSTKTDEKKCLDKIITLLNQYSSAEKGSLQYCIDDFAGILNQTNQHLDEFLIGFEQNVIQDLSEFKARCKHLKNDLKASVNATEQETIRQRQLLRLESMKDQECERISRAEAELLKSKAENVKATKNLEQNADIFQQKKLTALRSTLLSWASLELRYHARALELFTDAYQAAAAIDVASDLEEFRGKMSSGEKPSRLMTVHQTTASHHHLDIVDAVSNGCWSDPEPLLRTNSRQSAASSSRSSLPATDSSRSK